jgi:hypothetical protein
MQPTITAPLFVTLIGLAYWIGRVHERRHWEELTSEARDLTDALIEALEQRPDDEPAEGEDSCED